MNIFKIALLVVVSTLSIGAYAEAICPASNFDELNKCIAEVKTKPWDKILIKENISCSNCTFRIGNLTRPLTISGENLDGQGNPLNGITRSGPYADHLLIISVSSAPLTITNLRLDEGPNVAQGEPGKKWNNLSCGVLSPCEKNTISLNSVSNVLIENVHIIDNKKFGISLSDTHGVFIRNSLFKGGWESGIWMALNTSGVHIENNRFLDVRNTAISFHANVPQTGDIFGFNTIAGNTFSHNHHAVMYTNCGAVFGTEGPCGGGQLYISQGSKNVIAENNEIMNGKMDEDPSVGSYLRTHGIELSPQFGSEDPANANNMDNISVQNNYVHDLTGTGTFVHTPVFLAKMYAKYNIYKNVGTGMSLSPEQETIFARDQLVADVGNVLLSPASTFSWKLPAGDIAVSETVCSATGVCSSKLSWSSTTHPTSVAKIYLNRNKVFATSQGAGSASVTYRKGTVKNFDFYHNSTLLDSVKLGE